MPTHKHIMTITSDIDSTLNAVATKADADMVIALTDSHTTAFTRHGYLSSLPQITIPAGDENKDLKHLKLIWDSLTELNATRHSLLICLGGGMITDIGGLAAATYKRGMKFINIPTTILAAVDASVGGKTGINHNGLKNLIGVFAHPEQIIIYPEYFRSLSMEMQLSGMAEMIKHALLDSKELLTQTLSSDIGSMDVDKLSNLICRNIDIKQRIIDADPTETGIRKALNLGHTLGHAFEAYALQKHRPIPHGYAVMWGLVGELYLSVIRMNFDKSIVSTLTAFARNYYPRLNISCKDYDALINLMQHDKKNHHGKTRFTLMADIAKPVIDCNPTTDEINEALDYITGII